MRLTPSLVPYSSIVGGGLTLMDDKGRYRFIINIMGTTEGITREENDAIARAIEQATRGGIDVPDRVQPKQSELGEDGHP